jgi:hypothetical protein
MIQRTMNRRTFAITGLGVVLSTRTTLAQPATPASPTPADAVLYRVDLPASTLPPAPVAVGAAGVMMTPGTSVVYAEGASGQSIAIDHVLTGDYDVESDGELIHIDTDGTATSIDAGETTTVAAGQTIVFLQNEAAHGITAGGEETRTLTVGVFSLQQGTNEASVEGTLEQEVLGGTVLQALPESGITVTVVPAADASEMTDSVAQFPVTLSSGEVWIAVFLPMTSAQTPASSSW